MPDLGKFGPLLRKGKYMVVEDGIVIDTAYCDYFGHNFTYTTNGYLRKS